MAQISSIVGGSVVIDEDSECSGMIGGDVSVEPGVRFYLSGMVRGDLIVKRGAVAVVNGMVGGRVQNRGGRVEMSGLTRA